MFQRIGMCDPRVSLEVQKTAEDLIYDTDTEGKCQSEVSVDLPRIKLNLSGHWLPATWTHHVFLFFFLFNLFFFVSLSLALKQVWNM